MTDEVPRPPILDDLDPYEHARSDRTPWGSVNEFVRRYPLAFSLIVVAFCLAFVCVVVAAAFGYYGGRIADNEARLDAQDRHACLDASFDFALAEWIGSLVVDPPDPVVVAERTDALRAASADLVRDALAGTDSTIVCRPVLTPGATPTTGG